MDWRGCPESTDIEDRRGNGNGGRKTPGIIDIIVLLVGAYYDVNLSGLVGTAGLGTGTVRQGSLTQEGEKEPVKVSKVVLVDTEATWRSYFSKKLGKTYTPIRMVFYTDGTYTSCGAGQAAMGPFYCPGGHSVYSDLSLYDDMRKKLGASDEAALAYVIAYEVGHHVQNLSDILPEVNKIRQSAGQTQAGVLLIKLELQADCLIGVWGHYAANKKMLKTEDIQQAMTATESVGNGRFQQNAQGYVVPDSFTHGPSADRTAWLKRGLESGDIGRYDTFIVN